MRVEIVQWIRKAMKRYKVHAYYQPKNNTYVLHYFGRAIQNFSESNFYEIPPAERMKMIEPLMKVGLNNNLKNKNYEAIIGPHKNGHRIR